LSIFADDVGCFVTFALFDLCLPLL
jgi:hypothetical protein